MKSLYFFLLCGFFSVNLAAQSNDLYKNPDAPIPDRVQILLSQMTLEEKVGQMTQLNITLINTTGEQKDVELVESKALMYLQDHHIGSFLNGEAVSAEKWYDFIYNLQKLAVEETRLGIPLLYGLDHMHGASYLEGATIFPHNLNLSSTFDTKHAAITARVTALESAEIGHHWIFAPVLDLGRNPKWPRLYETFGESYYIASEMGEAYTKALQNNEEISPYKVAATGKHYLGYSDPKSGWDRTPVDLSAQAMFEFHAPSFQAAIDAGLETIMVNSGEVNGVPVHASKKLLTDVLRKKMGFDGLIITDWDDIGKLEHYHYTAANYAEATEMAVNAGIDMSMTPTSLIFNESLLELVENGKVSEARIDESVERILTLKFKLGLFENPYPRKDNIDRIGSSEHRKLAREAAEESIILLKNEKDLLPLSKATKRILLIGPSANSKQNLAGGWTIGWQGGGSPERYPKEMHTLFTALSDEYSNAKITLLPFDADESRLISEGKKNDVIIAAIGEEPYTEFIGNITSQILPEDQQSLLKSATKTGKPLITVFIGGRPLIISDVIEDIDAYLWAGLPGFEGAEAIANVISGDVNPSAKLSFSYPKYTAHFVPYNHKSSDVYFFDAGEANSITQGEKNVWEWPFGYGMAYTNFTYSEISLSDSTLSSDETLKARVTVTNAGKVSGKEAVIWFLKDHVGSITRPVKEVKYFEKIELAAGESKEVEFEISPDSDLAYPDENGNRILEKGYFTVFAGDKSKRFYLVENQLTRNQ